MEEQGNAFAENVETYASYLYHTKRDTDEN